MGHDDIYFFAGRIIKMKDVDKCINKIGTWRDNDTLKKWLILAACCLLVGATFLLVRASSKIKKSPETQTNQEIKIKPLNNPTKIINYITSNCVK